MNYILLSSCNYGSDSNFSNRFNMTCDMFSKQLLQIWRSPVFLVYKVSVTLPDGYNCLLPKTILALSVPGWSNV